MASLKKKAFSVLVVVFGLLAGLGLFVSGQDSFSRDVPTEIQAPQEQSFYAEVPSSPSAFIEARILGGPQGRDVPPTLSFWSGFRSGRSQLSLAVRGIAPTRSFDHPKDYYVYTLERILC